jgi:hypothetical protein
MYVYKRTEPTLWTVGHYDGGQWEPESDHGSEREAADRVTTLNGGTPVARSSGSAREYWTGHRAGYMDAIVELWAIQRDDYPQGGPVDQVLGQVIADLRVRYSGARERAASELDEVPA